MKPTLSPKELAEAIGVSESSLKRWVDEGVIQASRTRGGHRRIALAEAVRYIRESGIPIIRPDILGISDVDVASLTQAARQRPESLFPSRAALPLLTDLYELTMAAGYYLTGKQEEVAFEAYIRTLPVNRSFLLAAGLEQALYGILNLRFNKETTRWLRSLPQFKDLPAEFFDYLQQLRFAGDVWAIPEGTAVFANQPLVRVEASLIEAQILETYLLTCLNLQTLVASKAARINLAARGRPVVDFGARRAHGPQAGLLAARASIIGGCSGTSNVEAARILGVPAVGTMAHSWVMAFDKEETAFATYADVFPQHTICLIDTYDTLNGAKVAAQVVRDRLAGVRLDSGNLLDLSRRVRQILDEAGCRHTRIVASSDLNEFVIDELLRAGAPIDSFGVGTDMVTSRDAPALSVVYKLVATRDPAGQWQPAIKRSEDKATLGGRKQVWRRPDPAGRTAGDVIGLADEQPAGEPLLKQYIKAGELIADLPTVQQIAEQAKQQIEQLPEAAKQLRGTYSYPVTVTPALQAAQPP